MPIGLNPFLDTPQSAAATEHKKGYVMRKCCYDSNYKKSEFQSSKQTKPTLRIRDDHWCSAIRSMCSFTYFTHIHLPQNNTPPKPRAGFGLSVC